jgi:hypothetical protein
VTSTSNTSVRTGLSAVCAIVALTASTLAVAGVPAVAQPVPAPLSAGAAPATARGMTPPYAANRKATIRVRFREAVRRLHLAQETPRGYDRDRFGDWRDADGDCRDTRAEVLVTESLRATTGDCTIENGRWFSSYDRVYWTDAGDVDIDHLVPLFEVWRSGGKAWGSARRVAYANDLADSRTLRAVTDNVNQSKGDQDPSDWMPEFGRCVYARQYIAVKIRWNLRVNGDEKDKLRRIASHCPNAVIRVHKARVVS